MASLILTGVALLFSARHMLLDSQTDSLSILHYLEWSEKNKLLFLFPVISLNCISNEVVHFSPGYFSRAAFEDYLQQNMGVHCTVEWSVFYLYLPKRIIRCLQMFFFQM